MSTNVYLNLDDIKNRRDKRVHLLSKFDVTDDHM